MTGFKSKAHQRKFTELLADGKITQADYDKMHKATNVSKLPDRLRPKKEVKK